MKSLVKIVIIFLVILILMSFNFINAVNLNLTENVNDVSASTLGDHSSSESISTSATVKTGNVSDSSLNLSNILSIFLIVIGILIVLLAIAILIKLK